MAWLGGRICSLPRLLLFNVFGRKPPVKIPMFFGRKPLPNAFIKQILYREGSVHSASLRLASMTQQGNVAAFFWRFLALGTVSFTHGQDLPTSKPGKRNISASLLRKVLSPKKKKRSYLLNHCSTIAMTLITLFVCKTIVLLCV